MSRTGAVTSSAPADTKNGRIFTKEDFQSWEIPSSSDNNFRRTYFSHHTTEKSTEWNSGIIASPNFSQNTFDRTIPELSNLLIHVVSRNTRDNQVQTSTLEGS